MMSKEEIFSLDIGKLEAQRLENHSEGFEVKRYLNDEFYFDIEASNRSTKVYHVLQTVWSGGILEVFIKNNVLTDKLEVKDLVAFDSARFVKLVTEVLTLQLINEKEAWGLLFLNASRVQDTFEDAQAFTKSYLKGSLYYEILFKSDEESRGEKIQNFDALFTALYETNQVELSWLNEDIFKTFKIEKIASQNTTHSFVDNQNAKEPQRTTMYQLLAKEDKQELWECLDNFSQEERNQFLSHLYVDKKDSTTMLTTEEYLELPSLYPHVSYAYYLRGVYFYHYAWEARGFGITNTVGQKNYALFYERLRYAKSDLKKAYELSPNEQTYWAELYNLVKHFRSKESDELQEELYARIKKDAMQNPYCIQRVSHLNKARWGGSHKESLRWAREVVAHSQKGDGLKIIIFEALLEQYAYTIEFDKDETKANAIFTDKALQNEVNEYFEELLEHESQKIKNTLMAWYEKVGDKTRLVRLQ